MRTDRLSRRDRPAITLRICTGPLERAKGLLFEPALPHATALWLTPCRAVHTFGMREPIDVAFVDARGLVLRVVEACAPWRAVHEARAESVLELRAGECERLGLRAGERLALPRPSPQASSEAGPESESTVRLGRVLALVLVLAVFTWVAGCSAVPTRPSTPAPHGIAPSDELDLQAGLEYASRNWPAAHAAYAELVRAAPGSAEYRYRLGLTLLRLGRTDEAATALEAARALPGAPGAARALAVVRLVQARDALAAGREPDAALEAVERLLPREFARATGTTP